jgi:fatty acid-binding protein DegV
MLADGLISWLAGQPNVAASVKRAAGIKGDLDHFGATNFLVGLLTILRDSGFSGLVMVLDEVETLQRMRTDTREKGLNALRQWIDEIDAGRYPGLYLVVTGTPAFFDGPQGVQRLAPLAQRLHVDFGTDRRFDNPRAVQIRLAAFDHTSLLAVGRRVRDIYADGRPNEQRLRAVVDDSYLDALARAVAGGLGGKVGVAPRLFLKKLVLEFDYVICLTIASTRSPIFERTQKSSFNILTRYRPVREAAGLHAPFAMRVYDSRTLFAGQGVQILELARLLREDMPVTRVFKRMEEIIPQTYAYLVPTDLYYLYHRARKRGDRSVGFFGYTLGSALDIKPIARSFRGETGPVAKARPFDAAAERVFANITREIGRGLLAPFVNLSYGGDWKPIQQLPGYQAMAKAAQARGVEICWSHLSITAGVNVGPGALTAGIIAQSHEFE